MYSWGQRLRSLRHGFWYRVSERVRWSRGVRHETPIHELPPLTCEQSERLSELWTRYPAARFESTLSAATAMNNYEYLDMLDRAWTHWGGVPARGGLLCDIGCASFWYAATLMAFFAPREIVGVEIEGYRLFRDGRSRIDYAAGYLARLPGRFLIADYVNIDLPADIITAWFPFVTPVAILAWRLPLSLLRPKALLARVSRNLLPDGVFLMVNHGADEAARAAELCSAVGLRCVGHCAQPGLFSAHRLQPAVLSRWKHA